MFDDFDDEKPKEYTNLREQTDVWYEKYRPQTLEEMILPQELKDKIRYYLSDGGYKMPHLGLFSRNPGTGKSSLAKVIIKELDAEAIFVNASLDRGIDVLKTHIQRFAAQAPLKDGVKIVVMDEFDAFTSAGQDAFKNFIDSFGRNVRFIFTGNYKENIIAPLLDRMEVHDFNNFKAEDIVKQIYDKLIFILDKEGIQYDRNDVKAIIKQEFPGIRRMIGEIGKHTHNGVLKFSMTQHLEKIEELGSLLKSKNYDALLKVVYSMGPTEHFYGLLGENLDKIVEPKNKINAIIILSKYQSTSTDAKDKHLNFAACMAELMKL